MNVSVCCLLATLTRAIDGCKANREDEHLDEAE